MEPPELPLETMHATYNRLTGQNLPFKWFEREWFQFQRFGFTHEHLVLVLDYIQTFNRNPRNEKKISLNLHKLLEEKPRFAGYWGQADLAQREQAAKTRQWQPTAGERARAAMCHHEPVPPEKEPVLPRDIVAQEFRKLSEKLRT